MNAPQAVRVQTEVGGEVPEGFAELATEKVGSVLDVAGEPVLYVRIRLTMEPNPAIERPAVAQANLDVNGRLVRAQVAAGSMREAIDALRDRIRDRLGRTKRSWEAIRGAKPVDAPHEWRRTAEPSRPVPYFPRAPEERQIVRHKAFTLTRQGPSAAVDEMELLDYDFHLFTEAASGQDSVVYRAGDHYRLAQAKPRPDRLAGLDPAIELSPKPARRLTIAEAIPALEIAGWPFLFFVNAETGRGNLLYHRYDGHYGLITPADT